MARKQKEETATPGALPKPSLRAKYKDTVAPKLMEQFKYTSAMQLPKLDKIVINMGTGAGDKDPKHLENSVRDLTLITGQKPVVTVAKKAISNFKIREGMKIGCKVTLRGDQMYHFFDKLVTGVLPRIRDFQGISPKSSTDAATMPWASRSSWFSLRSPTTPSIESAVWTSSSARPPRPTKKPRRC